MKTKICTKCKIRKSIKEFCKKRNNTNSICKKCCNQHTKNWEEKNKLYRKEYLQNYYQLNKEKILRDTKIYRLSHKKELAEYMKNKRHINLNLKIKGYIANRMWHVLKGSYKSNSTMKLLDCSLEFLRNYLQNRFINGMSWSNYGKWHIDHIKPCASFNLSKPSEQRKCFHYTNLQPLWAKDNQSKRDTLITV